MPSEQNLHVEPGHYYSPIPSEEDFQFAQENRGKRNLEGINFNHAKLFQLAEKFSLSYPEVMDWLTHQTRKFTLDNTWFFGSDAITLILMVLHSRPKRIIEVGSGYSTALLEEIQNRWFVGKKIEILSVDPNPQRANDLEISFPIFDCPVQKLDQEYFWSLQHRDILLIDGSHVLKAGSDVDYLFNEILPRLKPGVRIHVHDIFYPFEYPESWQEQKIAFNEAYALEMLLRNSDKIKILYWNNFLEQTHKSWFSEKMPACLESKFITGGI